MLNKTKFNNLFMRRLYFRLIVIAQVIVFSGGMISAQDYGWGQIGSNLTGTGSFGKNLSLSSNGTIMAVGAPAANSSTGYVAVYENQGGSWIKLGSDIPGDAASDQFGNFTSLSSDGTILAVGAHANGAGYVKLFKYNGVDAWNDLGTTTNKIDGAVSGDLFGRCVSLSDDGTLLAVGADANDGNGANSGATYVYEFNSGTSEWEPKGNVIYGSAGDRSGFAVSFSGDGSTLAVGSYLNDSGVANGGTVRIYTYNNGTSTWDLKGSQINGVQAQEYSGAAVSLNSDGSVIAIGVYLFDVSTLLADAGCTRIYGYSGDWTQIGTNIKGKIPGEQSGKAVDISPDGTQVIIGAPLTGTGRARVYKLKYGDWRQVGADLPGLAGGNYYGKSVAINNDGTVIAIGTEGPNFVKAFTLMELTWTGAADDEAWTNIANWDLGVVPNTNYSVVIPADATSYPSLTAGDGAECSKLIIESTSTGTGSLTGQGELNVDLSTTVQRYMTGVDWHLITSPTPDQIITGFLLSNSGISSKGSSPVYRAMADYDETNNLWNSYFVNVKDTIMGAGKGYEIRTDADGIVEFTGTLQTSSVSAAVTLDGSGWNCIGNPYPSAIYINEAANPTDNFITLNTSNLDESYQAIYVWNPTTTSYDIITSTISDDPYSVAVGQAFMVKAKTAGNLSFTTAMQNHNSTVEFKGGIISSPEIKLIAKMSERTSNTKINFKEGMSDGLDVGYDVGMFKTDFNLYTRLIEDNGIDFGIQYLPETSINKSEIALGLDTKTSGTVKFYAEMTNLPEGTKVILEDRLNGIFTELENGDIYSAQIEKDESSKGRFYLHTSNALTSVNGLDKETDFNVYYSNERIYIAGQVVGRANAMLFDVMGRKITDVELERSALNYIPTIGLKNGIYMLNIQSESGVFSKKIAVSR